MRTTLPMLAGCVFAVWATARARVTRRPLQTSNRPLDLANL